MKHLSKLSLVACLAGASVPMYAQIANGTITGRLTDSGGAIIPGAQVLLLKTDTNLTLKTQTNSEGIYTFPALGTGKYTLSVEQPGFKKATSNLTLTVGQTASIDLTLEIGSNSETVDVQAAGQADLETSDATISYTVGARQVSDLPLNGRNPYGLAALSPGINPGGSFGAGVATARGAVVAAATNNFEANGGLSAANDILLDGVPISVCCQGQPALTPSVEVVDQFKVITSTPSAQFGRTSGGILNIVTKSGTNGLHGTAYEYFRNDKLDAANFFTKRSGVYPIPTRKDFRLPHRYNQYGVFVNGPVRLPKIYNGKDKTFFTFGWEATRNTTNVFNTVTVPTALQRQGIFTEGGLGQVYDPYSNNGTTRQPLPAGCNAAGCFAAGYGVTSINPVAQQLLQFLPMPNAAGLSSNYSYSYATSDKEDQFNFRVDHNFSANQRVFVRGSRDVNNHHENDLFNGTTGPSGINQALTAYLFAAGDTWTVTPSLVLQTNYGFAYQKNFQIPQNYTGFQASKYGFNSSFDSQQQLQGLPFITINNTTTGVGYANMSNATNTNRWEHYSHFLNSTAVWQRGLHTLTFGYDGRLILEHQQSAGNGVGNFTFDSTLTKPNSTGSVTGNQANVDSLAAFLLGTFSSASLQRQVLPAYDSWYHAPFFQDDWKVFPTLTLNMGIRWDIETGYRERQNRWADLDLNVANPLSTAALPFTGGARFLGVNYPNRTWKTSYTKFSPRFGLAWQVTPKTVIRSGFSLLYLPTSQRFYSASTLGYSISTATTFVSTQVPTTTIANPFPSGVQLPQGAANGVQVGTGTSVTGVLYDTPLSYNEQWNLGVERQLARGIVLHLNYVGSHSLHLPQNIRPNDLRDKYWGAVGDTNYVNYLQASVANPFYGQPNVGNLNTPTVQRAALLAAYPQYTTNSGMANGSLNISGYGGGTAEFNAAQAFVTMQPSPNLTATVSYTFSKSMTNAVPLTAGFLNANGTPNYQNSYHIRDYEWSVASTDVPHRLVANANYTLPFGRGQRFGSGASGWVNQIIGGWGLNTIIAVQSGAALGITQTGGPAFSGSRPMFVQGVDPLNHGDVRNHLGTAGAGYKDGYFNWSGFTQAQSFQLGNVPRSSGYLRSVKTFQDDLSLIKYFPIHESIKLQFRLEAFNVLNKVQFGLPNTTYGASNFGQITSQANLPRNVQAALKLNF
ncbi:carboxypeptidase regulatory-like domain-containing protein [Terriglobus sp. ADX1]|uniref:carboxypeptidase regulatory-like domain-containing protein n=1 Tax=Terriglobus sp. ADX1 TaxID=2794063 RepID=UPI002FE5260B